MGDRGSLVLTRKDGQAVYIGDDVRIVVLTSRLGKVRLRIEADRTLDVDREEVYLRRRSLGGSQG